MNNNQSLLPINSSALLRDLEKASEKSLDLKTLNRFVNNPDQIYDNLLPWLGWSLSIDSWDDNWSLDIKRKMIRNSILLHKTKGTRGSIKRALEILGLTVKIVEWWEINPQLEPHTFQLTAYLNDNITQDKTIIITKDTQKKLINLINSVKPLRSHLNFRLGVSFESQLFYCASFRIKNSPKLLLESKISKFVSKLKIAASLEILTYKQING